MFDNINQEEYNKLKEAVPMIAVLIAGADGNIDEKEKEWAAKVARIRSYAYKEELMEFYSDVEAEFENKLSQFIANSPKNPVEKQSYFSAELSSLNRILHKMDQTTGHLLYNSYVSFAEHVAKASGGFLRFGTISKEESKLINLPMLIPIDPVTEEDDITQPG